MSYQNGKIYKVICSETGDVYIGSTYTSLADRMRGHTAPSNGTMSKSFMNPTIHLINEFPCNNKAELLAEERKFVKEMECVNRNIPGRTRKERDADNSNKIKQQTKQYKLDNADEIKKWNKQYNIDNADKINKKFDCQCGGKYTHAHKSRHFKSKKHLKFINLNN